METERLHMPDNSRRAEPIPGAPDGKCWRMCKASGHTSFYLVKAFHGVSVYQCLTCRQIAKVDHRTGKTCMNCGKPLDGRKINWCCPEHGTEVANSHDRETWVFRVKRRDNHTCQRCGYLITPELKAAFEAADKRLWAEELRSPLAKKRGMFAIRRQAMRETGYRQLEAHHITPLEWGGPEFDLANGMTLCEPCHDQVHRELGALRPRRRGAPNGEEKKDT